MADCLRKIGAKKRDQVETQRRVKALNAAYNDRFKYASNYINTAKYNVFTFLPKNLFEQFQRLANFYFLCLMILQLIPQISSLTAYTTIVPLVTVLAMTALKDAVDDIQRHRSDRTVNNRKSHLVRHGKLESERWQNVKVGDIIKMSDDQFVAADLLLLSTSEPNGLCYIETAELDGETNLKARQALVETAELHDDLRAMSEFDGEIVCEPPNNRLNTFEGKLTWKNQTFALDNDKMLLRGSVLRNTKWCYGVVIFAGKDSKLMMNSGKTKFKRTSLDEFLNVLILGIVVFLFSIVVICMVLCGIFEESIGQYFELWIPREGMVPKSSVTGGSAFIAFLTLFSYFILLNAVVPISLYVTFEVIRLMQSWMINWDKEMYYAVNDTPAKARTTTLNEQLGQIQYIFSDKTGTLTRNIMEFKKCSVNGVMYGEPPIVPGSGEDNTKPLDFSFNKYYEKKFVFCDKKLLDDTRAKIPQLEQCWRLIALCHTIMPDYKDGKLTYQAQSPDEDALVSAARNFGFVFKSRTPSSITIEVNGMEETYELLSILDFNNVRKRMSVILRRDGRITLYCKGADTIIYGLIKKDPSADQLKKDTQTHLDSFASEGLRTLCLAYKEISAAAYDEWKTRYHEASISLDNRQEKMDVVAEEMEKNMTLMGATAIEDKLQDGVPQAIANLAHADIKIWVLTGDKQETAINIGHSCRLLTDEMHDVFIVDANEKADVQDQLTEIKRSMDILTRVKNGEQPTISDSLSPMQKGNNNSSTKLLANSSSQNCIANRNLSDCAVLDGFALVVNGHSLIHALEPSMELLLLEVASACKAVICCRVTPLQKALVVDLVKRNKKAVTLAIGDGANDVSMIKMAHIGIGISGQEGLQAVLAADYSIAQFRFLERLLLVHGRWSYLRMSKFLTYFFYKNFAYTLAHFWFAFFCGYSAQSIYDPILIVSYNLIFTSTPVIALGIFDQDVNDQNSIRYPKLYVPGQTNQYFNLRSFVTAVIHGIVSSLVVFFIPFCAFNNTIKPNGATVDGLQTLSFTIYSSLIVVVTAEIAVTTYYWTVWNHLMTWISVVLYFLLVIVYYEGVARIIPVSAAGASFSTMSCAPYWLSIVLCVVILVFPAVARRFVKLDVSPTLNDKIRYRQNVQHQERLPFEFPFQMTPSAPTSARRRRSSYAFAHQEGFGELITKGLVMLAKIPVPIREEEEPEEEETGGTNGRAASSAVQNGSSQPSKRDSKTRIHPIAADSTGTVDDGQTDLHL